MAKEKWADLRPFFEKVTIHTNGCYEPDDILDLITDGEHLLWIAWDEQRLAVDAVMTTRLVEYPRRIVCHVPYIAGKHMGRWLKEFQSTVEDYALKSGATGIEGAFRRGWARACGMRETGVTLFKDLMV